MPYISWRIFYIDVVISLNNNNSKLLYKKYLQMPMKMKETCRKNVLYMANIYVEKHSKRRQRDVSLSIVILHEVTINFKL